METTSVHACCYCKKTFSSNSSLFHHQRTVKRCLQFQEKIQVQFKCSFCEKQLTTKYNLEKHVAICKMKIKHEHEEVSSIEKKEFQKKIDEKDAKIKELLDRLDQQEKNPRVKNITNHYNIQNIYKVMTPERVEDFFKKHYNFNTLMGGIPEFARFICDGFIREKGNYICTDRSRHKFIMKDKDGNAIEDTNCQSLVSLTAPGMKHVKDVYENGLFSSQEEYTEEDIHSSYQPISELDKDPSSLKKELSKIVPNKMSCAQDVVWTDAFEMLRESYTKNSEKIKQDDSEPVLQMIGEYSLGSLQVFKEGYKQRKEKANGNPVEIKGPKRLMENPLLKEQYEAFILG